MSRLEKPQVDKVINARGLEIGQVLGVIQVSLRVQVTVADFDWVKEAEFGHASDYTVLGVIASCTPAKQSPVNWSSCIEKLPSV
jgi:hypothetical protein